MTSPGPAQHPAWFGAVMGTGALALALSSQAVTWNSPWLEDVAVVVLLLATVLAVFLTPRYARRLRHRAELRQELAHPASGAMLATLPAGILVLASAWGRVAPPLLPDSASLWINGVLLVVGVAISLPLGLAWTSSMLNSRSGLEGVSGGWLIPPIMNLLVALALTELIAANSESASLLLLVGFAFYGLGTLLFLAMFPLVIARLILNGSFPAPMAPTMWIPLAPAGMIGLALIRLLESGQDAGVEGLPPSTTGVLIAAMGIGFGLWWAAFALLDIRRVRRASTISMNPGWWGFVFPIGAMALSIAAVGAITDLAFIQWMGALATIALIVVWALVSLKTLRMLRATH